MTDSSCAAAGFASQGPDWLACWYLQPPGWLNPALAAIGGAVALVVLYRLRERGWTVDLETQRAMLAVAWTVAGVLVATQAMVRWAGQPYVVDVGAGVLAGWGGVQGVVRAGPAVGWPTGLATPRERLAAAWAALAVLAVLGPAVVAPGATVALRWGRWYLVALAAAMLLYNAREFAEAGS